MCPRSWAAGTLSKFKRDIMSITSVLIILKNWKNNGTEKSSLVTPIPGLEVTKVRSFISPLVTFYFVKGYVRSCEITSIFGRRGSHILERKNHRVIKWFVCNIFVVSYHNITGNVSFLPWWRHQMETFSALLALCVGNSPVPVNSPHKDQWRGALMFLWSAPE